MPRLFRKIPDQRPLTPLLDLVNLPADLRQLPRADLPALCDELREFLLYTVGQTGGHFGAGLGVVELTVALHYALDTPHDALLWDVGHQAYPHKILTGRRARMSTLRATGGLAPFPQRDESTYDVMGVGHSSTSLSAALGLADADRHAGRDRRVVAVIGDGAMTAGMAYEALNHAATLNLNLTVVFNDNAMSISENTGGLARFLAGGLGRDEPADGRRGVGALLAGLGFRYTGPVDGHDIEGLVKTLTNAEADQPHTAGGDLHFIHVVTTKGKGYAPAEQDPVASHSLTKIEPQVAPHGAARRTSRRPAPPTYANVFGQWAATTAAADTRLIAITPAMREGSDLVRFSEQFPDRFRDVAIAEQHAVTFAAGHALGGSKPVLAIYSTFLQRGYDQLIHDVAIQNLDVTFAIDRAGLVEDGPTHAGIFDLSFLRCLPNLRVFAPADAADLVELLTVAWRHPGPTAVRYPRGSAPVSHATLAPPTTRQPDGHPAPARWLRHRVARTRGPAILSFGHLLELALAAGEAADATVVDMRAVKPLDTQAIEWLAANHDRLVTLEENVIAGGAGSGVAEALAALRGRQPPAQLKHCGIGDTFVPHGALADQRAACGLTVAAVVAALSE